MKIGACTTDFEPAPARELFAKIRGMGFDSVQLAFASLAEMDFTPTGQIEIPPAIPDGVIELVNVLSREYDLPIDGINGTFNITHPDSAVRAEGIARFEVLSDAAARVGCPLITLCSGTRNPHHLWTYSPLNGDASAWEDMISSLKALCAIADRYDITLAVETEAANIIDTAEKSARMLEQVGSHRLKMVLDAANLFRRGEAHAANVDERLRHAMKQFGRDVVTAHGKDIREGDGIDFCPTGEGIVNFPLMVKLLREYGFEGVMMLHGIFDESKMPGCLAFMRGVCGG